VLQRFNLTPPEGQLLADKNQAWWDEQEFSELTGFQVQLDLEIIAQLETQKAKIDQKLAELSDTQPWADQMVFLMQIPGFGLLTSMILLAAVGNIARFSHSKKLVGYAGLDADVHDSGQKHPEKSTLAPAQTAGAVQVSPKQAARNCVGPWSRLPGPPCAVIPIGKPNINASPKSNIPMSRSSPQLYLQRRCKCRSQAPGLRLADPHQTPTLLPFR